MAGNISSFILNTLPLVTDGVFFLGCMASILSTSVVSLIYEGFFLKKKKLNTFTHETHAYFPSLPNPCSQAASHESGSKQVTIFQCMK